MISFYIPNMKCGGCARGVSAAIREVNTTAKIESDFASRVVSVETTAPEARLREALTTAGFAPS